MAEVLARLVDLQGSQLVVLAMVEPVAARVALKQQVVSAELARIPSLIMEVEGLYSLVAAAVDSVAA